MDRAPSSMPRSGTGRRRLFAVAALAVMLIASGCGGKNPKANPTSPSPGTSRSSPPRSSTTGGSSSTGTTTGSPKPGSSTPKPGKTGKPSPRATTTGGATATLERTCARRGVDQQTITITTTRGGPASYQTVYSDGSYAGDGHSHYSGGYGGGFDGDGFSDTQKDGRWQATWTVPANAPTGLTNVQAVTAQGNVNVTFNIVSQTGHCG